MGRSDLLMIALRKIQIKTRNTTFEFKKNRSGFKNNLLYFDAKKTLRYLVLAEQILI